MEKMFLQIIFIKVLKCFFANIFFYYIGMIIIQKPIEADLSQALAKDLVNSTKFMHNTQIKRICINHNELYLIRSTSIIVYHHPSKSIARVIQLNFQIDQTIYLPNINQFFAFQPGNKYLISFTNQENPVVKQHYSFNDNKGNSQFEWAPWIFYFENSQNIILVRKMYGESWIVIFNTFPTFNKIWQFSCNESSMSKMDESQYLVNYLEYNSKFCIKFTVYNTKKQIKDTYKVDNIEPSICKSVRLYQKTVAKATGIERLWVKVLVGVNYKTNGSGILVLNLLQQSENYEILNQIYNSLSQFDTILSFNPLDRTFQVLQYCYFQEQRQTKYMFTTYILNQLGSKIQVTHDKEVPSQLEGYFFNQKENQLITFTNLYSKKYQNTYQEMSHRLLLSHYRLVDKKIAYAHLMQNHIQSFNFNLIQSTLSLL